MLILAGEGGLEKFLDKDFAKADSRQVMSQATLFWNIVCMFRRERIPFGFLFQGSFGEQSVMAPLPTEC
tara:strand:+ start:421 stop:627 length:207 start_codon:yes stop_codon:yes gene_type:complete